MKKIKRILGQFDYAPVKELTTAQLAQELADRLQSEASAGVIVPGLELEGIETMTIHIHQDQAETITDMKQLNSQLAKAYEAVHPRIDLGMSEVVKNIQERAVKMGGVHVYPNLIPLNDAECEDRNAVSEAAIEHIQTYGIDRMTIQDAIQAVWRNGYHHGKTCDGSNNCGQ
jgi:hypothetical protein